MHFGHHGGINFSPSAPPIPPSSSLVDAHFNIDDESTLARAPPVSAHQHKGLASISRHQACILHRQPTSPPSTHATVLAALTLAAPCTVINSTSATTRVSIIRVEPGIHPSSPAHPVRSNQRHCRGRLRFKGWLGTSHPPQSTGQNCGNRRRAGVRSWELILCVGRCNSWPAVWSK